MGGSESPATRTATASASSSVIPNARPPRTSCPSIFANRVGISGACASTTKAGSPRTSGGLTSRGHPAYVTSLYNYVELADQLRGRAGDRQVKDARWGLATGELGNYNAALVHVLEAVR